MFEKIFYYLEKNNDSNAEFTFIPTGCIEVDRLIANKAYWKKLIVSGHLKKKTVVIDDWTAESWSTNKIMQVKKRLAELLQDQFTIFIWQDGRLISFDHRMLDRLDDVQIRKNITPVFDDELMLILTKEYQRSKDQVLFLDDHQIKRLIDKNHPLDRVINVEDIIGVSHDRDDFLAVLRQAKPKLKKIVNKTFSEKAFIIFDQLKKAFPKITASPETEVPASNDLLLDHRMFSGFSITEKSLLQFETLDLSHNKITPQLLEYILKHAENLKTLKLSYVTAIEDINLEGTKFYKLETLALSGVTLSIESLYFLLRHTKRLRELRYVQDSVCEHTLLQKIDITNLEILEVSRFLFQQFIYVLKHAKFIKEISLSGCKNLLSGVFTEKFNLFNLKRLRFNHTNITFSQVQYILKSANNIEEIHLSHCEHLLGGITQGLSLTKLRRLNLSFSDITFSQVQYILKSANNIEEINLSHCQHLSGLFTKSLSFTKLRRLNLSYSDITFSQVQYILKSANNIEEINLSHCQHLSGAVAKNFNFSKLKKLNLSHSGITVPQLEHLLESGRNIKEINLSYCGNLSEHSSKFLNLPKIEKLTLSFSNIHTQLLQQLLKHSENLIELHLNNTDNLLGEITEGFPLFRLKILNLSGTTLSMRSLQNFLCAETLCLNELAKVYFSPSNVNAKILKQFLKKAPRLEELDMLWCSNLIIDGNDHELQYLLSRITRVLYPVYQRRLPSYVAPASSRSDASNEPIKVHHNPFYSKKMIDTDTSFQKNTTLLADRIFYTVDGSNMPDPSRYRLQVYDTLTVSNQLVNDTQFPFILENSVPVSLTECDIRQSEKPLFEVFKKHAPSQTETYYYGVQTLSIMSDWQPIASLSSNEVIMDIYVYPSIEIEIRYSTRDNMYYVRTLAQAVVTTIYFILKVPTAVIPLSYPIRTLIKEYNDFTSGTLQMNQLHPTGKDYLRAIQQQEKGACRHRVVAFKARMKALYPKIQVRIICNDLHAYVELYESGQWKVVDLGGYPSINKINEKNSPFRQNSAEKLKAAPPFTASQATTNSVTEVTTEESTDEEIIRALSEYGQYFETWRDQKERPFANLTQFIETIGKTEGAKQLITLTDTKSIDLFRYQYQFYCQTHRRPFFYIHSPEDLVCSAPFIKRTGNLGVLKLGPGGPLYDFLMANRHSRFPPILMINYAHDDFTPDAIVRFNSLLDDTRMVDGIPIPKNVILVGLININKPDVYLGSDFLSRFTDKKNLPVTREILESLTPTLPIYPTRPINRNVQSINLYRLPHWKTLLLGSWAIDQKKLEYKEGPLIAALRQGKSIEIQNGPWWDKAFQFFWRDAFLKGKIFNGEESIHLPENFQIFKTEGYYWTELIHQVTWQSEILSNTVLNAIVVLNPTRLSHFITQYVCHHDTKMLEEKSGILQQHQNKFLAVYVTRALNVDEWGLFLETAQRYRVQLAITLAPEVRLPEALAKFVPFIEASKPIPLSDTSATTVIQSNDIDATLSKIMDGKNYIVIDISECPSSNLLTYINAKLNSSELKFVCEQHNGFLSKILSQNNKVILKGSFSLELLDALAPFLVEYHHKTSDNRKATNGALILLSDRSSEYSFNFFSTQQQVVTLKDKKNLLIKKYGETAVSVFDDASIISETFIRLSAQLRFLHAFPERQPYDAWQGLESLEIAPILSESLDLHGTEQRAKNFMQKRFDAVSLILKTSPFAFLAGVTGVGKTTFIRENWKKEHPLLYIGEDQIRQWAEDRRPGIKTLLIDEANIADRQWSQFESLFLNLPSLFLKGEYLSLTPEHKVIFAGNPLNYGGGRQLASLFFRHGNVVLFEPLSIACLYEFLLKPIFSDTALKNEMSDIALEFFKMYRFLLNSSTRRVLISPREVSMMALLTIAYYERYPETSITSIINVAKFYAYWIGSSVVPDINREEFEAAFTQPALPKQAQFDSTPDFIVTPSREPISTFIDDLLYLREYRRRTDNDFRKSSGLNGLILEGEPGNGKSQLIVHCLLRYGLRRGDVYDAHITDDAFYILPVGMQPKLKKTILREAFKKGAVVIMDEFNTLINERLLNELLDNVLTSNTSTEKSPKKPGFLLFGTQNPINLAGREPISNALLRRVLRYELPPYPEEEIEIILRGKGLNETLARRLTMAYVAKLQEAKEKHLSPLPCFRDMWNAVTDITSIRQQQVNSLDASLSLVPQLKHVDQCAIQKRINFENNAQEWMRSPEHLLDQSSQKSIAIRNNFTNENTMLASSLSVMIDWVNDIYHYIYFELNHVVTILIHGWQHTAPIDTRPPVDQQPQKRTIYTVTMPQGNNDESAIKSNLTACQIRLNDTELHPIMVRFETRSEDMAKSTLPSCPSIKGALGDDDIYIYQDPQWQHPCHINKKVFLIDQPRNFPAAQGQRCDAIPFSQESLFQGTYRIALSKLCTLLLIDMIRVATRSIAAHYPNQFLVRCFDQMCRYYLPYIPMMIALMTGGMSCTSLCASSATAYLLDQIGIHGQTNRVCSVAAGEITNALVTYGLFGGCSPYVLTKMVKTTSKIILGTNIADQCAKGVYFVAEQCKETLNAQLACADMSGGFFKI